MWERYTASSLFRSMAPQRRGLSNWRTKMNITFRYLSAPSKCLPALIALGVNAIFFWGAVRATSVLPPERVSRMSAAAVNSCDRSGRRDLTNGSEDEKCRAHASASPQIVGQMVRGEHRSVVDCV